MIKWFIQHQWRQSSRSSIWQKNIALNLVIGFFMLIMLSYLVVLGVLLDKILEDVVKDVPAHITLSKAIIYYFLFSFVFRFFMQNLPTMEIVPYLHLRIKRKTLAWYMVFKSLFSFFNFMPFFLFLPFAIRYMQIEQGSFAAFIWFATIFLFELTVNYKLIYFKRKFTLNPLIIIALIAILGGLIALDSFHIFSISKISLWYFNQLQQHWIWIALPLFTTLFFAVWNKQFILKNSYLDDLTRKTKEGESISEKLNLLQNFGKTGELVLNEIKLILRNKRPKSIMALLPLFLLYGLLIYPNGDVLNNSFLLAFVGIFISGGFIIAYGQYLMAWESTHFDFILSSNTGIYDYFKAKYFLLLTPTLLLYIFTVPYAFYGAKIFWINFAALLYNVGVNIPLLLYTASFNKKRMELSRSSMMNYQGIGANNFIMALPLIIVPALIFLPFEKLFGEVVGISILGGLGFLGLLFNQSLIRLAVKHFEKRRYIIAEGYRQRG